MNSKRISSLLSVILVTITLTRLWAMSLFWILGKNSQIMQTILTDKWHHYHVGLLILVIGIGLYKLKKLKSPILACIGLGIVLEEWAVVLRDIGFNTRTIYMTYFDFVLVTGVVAILLMVSLIRFYIGSKKTIDAAN